MQTLSAIGAGNMAGAILSGIVSSKTLQPQELGFYEIDTGKQEALSAKGLVSFASIAELCADSRYILLSVKPQVVPAVLEELKEYLNPDRHVLISIAAGISETFIKAVLGTQVKVILAMPNSPILVGEGATAMSRCAPITHEEFAFAMSLFAGAGIAREVPSQRMNEIIALNGSTPAYIYLFARYFCEYAQQHGIEPETANELFSQTLTGAAAMMTQTGKNHQELIDMVTSPGGTTLAGLESLKAAGMEKMIADCCEATIRRAYELGR